MGEDYEVAKIELGLALKILRILIETKERNETWQISKYHLKQVEVMLEGGLKLLV